MPQIEGVISDWIYEQRTSEKVPKQQGAKTRKFRDLIQSGAQRTYTDERVADAVGNFILDGPVLETFNDWLSPVADTFPNRHMIGHGKFSPALYSEESSIKLFLMLDTLYRIMAAAAP